MQKTKVFMFSGQGSQYYHMGWDLYTKNEKFRYWMDRLDGMASDILGESILQKFYDSSKKRGENFERLLYTHPAIFIIEYSLARTVMEDGIIPDYMIGSSLGEFVSAALAGVMSTEEALACTIRQAKIFESNCSEGGMLSIFCNYEQYQKDPAFTRRMELVSVNSEEHFVLAGSWENIEAIVKLLKKNNILYQILPVRYAFHSARIEPAREEFISLFDKISLKKPAIKYISSVYGKAMEDFTPEYFWHVVRKPINFREAISDVCRNEDCVFIDLGPSGTLANFTKSNMDNKYGSEVFSIMSPFGNDSKSYSTIVYELKKYSKEKRNGTPMIAYVFPGQGSQQKGMGAELFDEFADLTGIADKVLGYSIKELCTEDPGGVLAQTQYTQPALFIVSALSYLKKVKETGIKPDFVAGHSLGEYNALFAAGVFDFETGVKLVKKRGELMSKATGGGMAAVIGLTEEQIKEVLQNNKLDKIDVANFNTPKQIVISGPAEDIANAKACFEAAGAAKYVPLSVSGAFHSRYMREAKEEFQELLKQIEFSPASIQVISNVHARPYKNQDIKKNLADQIDHSVKWTESVRYLMGKGIQKIEQVGPGTAIKGMINTIQREAEPLMVDDEKEEVREETAVNQVDEGKKSILAIRADSLGSGQFKKEYGLKYAYIAGSMYKGVSSKEMVVAIAKAGMLGFLGTGGMRLEDIEGAIRYIQGELKNNEAYGLNLLNNPMNPEKEEAVVDLYLKYGVRNIEASAYLSLTPAIVRFRLKGLTKDSSGRVVSNKRIFAKVSRPEVAEAFLSPAPERIVEKLLADNKITREEAELSKRIAMVDALTVEADSGGHTDGGVAYAITPAMIKLRDDMVKKYSYPGEINIGAAGGIGTPEAAAAAFLLGADYIVTGSINQCTVEAGTSDSVKELLQQMNVQDTEYAPAGDMFEIGAKVQVLKKGLFFPARANKLYELYRQYNSLDEIDEKTRKQIEDKYFKKSFEEIFNESKSFYPASEIERAEKNPKQKMAIVFKWYFGYATNLALNGAEDRKVDYQVHCGPALGAFNQWVKDTPLETWRSRNVDKIAEKLMVDTAEVLNQRFKAMAVSI